MTPLAFLDCETTGVHPDRRVWEVAIIRRDNTGQRESALFVRADLSAADPFGLRVGRFYERHPAYSGTPGGSCVSEAVAAEWVERETRGAHLVGAVPSFDAGCLDPMLRRHGLIPAWHHHLIDVETLAVGWLTARGTPVPPPWRSDGLSRLCGVVPPPDDARHTAMGDAQWAMRWYDAITGEQA